MASSRFDRHVKPSRDMRSGMDGIAEEVRQLRGTSVDPVPDVGHVLVTAGVPTSWLILS
jgi:hypothetical protein